MWFCARRQCTIPSVTVLVCILLGLLILTKHLKELYDLNRKAQRFRRYTDFLNSRMSLSSQLDISEIVWCTIDRLLGTNFNLLKLEEVSDSMVRLEVNANKSHQNLQILNTAIDNRYRVDRPNA